jgi:hypothetical protein
VESFSRWCRGGRVQLLGMYTLHTRANQIKSHVSQTDRRATNDAWTRGSHSLSILHREIQADSLRLKEGRGPPVTRRISRAVVSYNSPTPLQPQSRCYDAIESSARTGQSGRLNRPTRRTNCSRDPPSPQTPRLSKGCRIGPGCELVLPCPSLHRWAP